MNNLTPESRLPTRRCGYLPDLLYSKTADWVSKISNWNCCGWPPSNPGRHQTSTASAVWLMTEQLLGGSGLTAITSTATFITLSVPVHLRTALNIYVWIGAVCGWVCEGGCVCVLLCVTWLPPSCSLFLWPWLYCRHNKSTRPVESSIDGIFVGVGSGMVVSGQRVTSEEDSIDARVALFSDVVSGPAEQTSVIAFRLWRIRDDAAAAATATAIATATHSVYL